MNPNDHLESEKTRIYEKRNFIIDNKECLCGHGGFHPIIEIKSYYIPSTS